MKLFRSFTTARRLLRSLSTIEAHLATQNQYLARLADHFAPVLPPAEDLTTQNSISFLNHKEAGRVVDYIDKTMRDTGRAPTEDEIVRYLAEEAEEESEPAKEPM
jgi:hypothetical protein